MAHWGVALPFRSGGETAYLHLDRLRTSVWWGTSGCKISGIRKPECATLQVVSRAANFVEVQAKFAEPSFHLLQKVMTL
jgi:hypothetical protein